MHTYDLFKQLVPAGSVLLSMEDGFNVRTRTENGFKNSFVTDADLSKIDARLPAAIRFFDKEVTTVESIFVSHMLQLWSTNSHVETVSGNLYGVTRVSNVSFTESSMTIRGDGYIYRVFNDPDTNEDLLIPTGPAPVIAEITKEWLNQNCTGWFERYKFARDLGMSEDEAFNSMVARPSFSDGVELPIDNSM